MAKNFFKQYFSNLQTLDRAGGKTESMTYNSLNYDYKDAVEMYVNSLKWCKNNTELQIYQAFKNGDVIKNMHITVTVKDEKGNEVKKELEEASVRSACSRLSAKMYSILGDDCTDVMLKGDEGYADRIKELIALCFSLVDNYSFQANYPVGFNGIVRQVIGNLDSIKVPNRLKISEINSEALMFFEVYNNKFILNSLKEADKKDIALIYKILTNPEYCHQRAEVLKVLGNDGVSLTYIISEATKLKDDKIKELKSNIDNMTVIQEENNKLNSEIIDLEMSFNTLKVEKETLQEELDNKISDFDKLSRESQQVRDALDKKTADFYKLHKEAEEKLKERRKRIEELEAQVNSLSNLDL